MYDKIKSLPLLRGAGEEVITSFLEKTNLEFSIHEEGELIVRPGDTCRKVCCLISGMVEISQSLLKDSLVVRETVPEGCVIGLEHLFGMDNKMNFTVNAVTRSGTMEFSKARYLKLLQSDNIFLMNCLNYLSHSSQKYEDMFLKTERGSAREFIAGLVSIFSHRQCTKLLVESTKKPLQKFFSETFRKSADDMKKMEEEGIIRTISENAIEILDREKLIDSILES